MSQQEQQQQADSGLDLPPATVIPTQVAEDGSSLEVGYTEADPSGPQSAEKEDKNLWAGKFKTPEEMAKAYKELESKLGGQQRDNDAPGKPEVDPNAPKVAAIENTDEAAAMLQEKGLNIASFTAEYETTGQLSEQSYASLEKAGIPKDMVNAYIEGQKVLVSSQIAEIKNTVGGEEAFTKLASWAVTGLSDSEKQDYEDALATNRPGIIKLAVAAVKAKYDAAMGKDPQVVLGGNAPSGNDGVDRFNSFEEMMSAMKDKRYDTDPAYRMKVEQKAYRSNF